MIKVGIDAEGFSSWGGGIDFIATISEALNATGEVETYLIYPKDSIDQTILKAIKCIIKSLRNRKSLKALLKDELTLNKELLEAYKILSPATRTVSYSRADYRLRNNTNSKKKTCVIRNKIDILLPSIKCVKSEFPIPQVGYLFDFQHKYLKSFFDEEIIKIRDKQFETQIDNSNYIIVNSKACRDDIFRFYPNKDCKVIALPFCPFQVPVGGNSKDIKKYKLPNNYYMISNQFWEHKNHKVAFKALELLFERGYKDIHIVCTGKMQDDKNPKYVSNLLEEVKKLQCRDNIHFLGYIPKTDQISIMKQSIGIIQPTLFEGGPGGGAVYNALCLGICCLISDISVNREIEGYNTVSFFDPTDYKHLADLMIDHMNDEHEDDEIIDNRVKNNKLRLGKYLLENITNIMEGKDTIDTSI